MLKDCRVHTTLPVADLARARTFYENVLGLSASVELPSGVFYACGAGTRFAVSRSAGWLRAPTLKWPLLSMTSSPRFGSCGPMGWVFEEYELPGLETVDGIADQGTLKAAWFRDGEGNLLAIMQPSQPID